MCELAGLTASSSLDVVELGAPDHPLLLLGRQRVPRVHVVHVLLHVHIAAAREVGILVADLGGGHRDWPVRVLGAVDETHQVAVVEELEAVHLVDDRDRSAHRLDDPARQLEADVHRLGPDVEQQIARRRRARGACRPGSRRTDAVRPDAVRRTAGPTRRSRSRSPPTGAWSGRGSRSSAPDPRCRRARRGRSARRRRRWSPPGRWPQASAAPEPVAAGQRAPSDPKSRSWAKMVNHVRKCTGVVRVHRRVAVAVPCVRDGRAAAARDAGFTELFERDEWPTKGRFFIVRAGSLVAWAGNGEPARAVPHRRRPHRQPQPAGQAASRPVRVRLAGGRTAALRRGVAELVARPRPRHQRQAVGALGRPASSTDWSGSTSRSCGCRSWPSIWPRTASRCRWTRSGTSTRSGASAADRGRSWVTSPSRPEWTPTTCSAST